MSAKFAYSMTEDQIRTELLTVPATQKQYTQLVQKLFKASTEYAVVAGNGKLLLGLLGEIRKGSKTHANTFVGAVIALTPIKYDKELDTFSFSQDKAVSIAHKAGWELKKPANGAQFSSDDLEKLALVVRAGMANVSWTDYKAERAPKPEASKDEKVIALRKKHKKLLEEADALGVALVETDPPVQEGQASAQVLSEFWVNIIAMAEEDAAIYQQIARIAETEALRVMKSAA